jgi:hypothetical protein
MAAKADRQQHAQQRQRLAHSHELEQAVHRVEEEAAVLEVGQQAEVDGDGGGEQQFAPPPILASHERPPRGPVHERGAQQQRYVAPVPEAVEGARCHDQIGQARVPARDQPEEKDDDGQKEEQEAEAVEEHGFPSAPRARRRHLGSPPACRST